MTHIEFAQYLFNGAVGLGVGLWVGHTWTLMTEGVKA